MLEIRVPHSPAEARVPRASRTPEARRVFRLPRVPRLHLAAGRR